MKPCYFCKRPTGPEYYCFGCHTVICESCDHENEWPPIGHTNPEQHPIRYKGKVEDLMSKISDLQHEVASLKAQLAYTAQARDSHWKSYMNTLDSKREELAKQKAEHDRRVNQIMTTATTALTRDRELNEIRVVQAQRDSIAEAYKYLADSVTAKKE